MQTQLLSLLETPDVGVKAPVPTRELFEEESASPRARCGGDEAPDSPGGEAKARESAAQAERRLVEAEAGFKRQAAEASGSLDAELQARGAIRGRTRGRRIDACG